jgi:hypothetical protein
MRMLTSKLDVYQDNGLKIIYVVLLVLHHSLTYGCAKCSSLMQGYCPFHIYINHTFIYTAYWFVSPFCKTVQ